MTDHDWDILVVGAGPAGGSAALAAAKQGARVLLVERRRQIGLPVQCAEYIPALLKGEIGRKDDYIVQKIEGMRTFIPGHAVNVMRAPGYVIRREILDQTLVSDAQKFGAKLRCATRVIGLDPEGKVMLSPKEGQVYSVFPRVIIGADGPRSTVGRWVGLVNRHLLPGVQVTLPLTVPLSHAEIYFDPAMVAGYGWLFPKGNLANVGLGMLPPTDGQPSLGNMLERFIRQLETRGRIFGKPVAYTAGWIPAEPLRNAVHGKVMLVGDAAGQTHSITGAGIFAAMTCGRLAGQYAGSAVAANDMTMLADYDREWQDVFGETLARAHRRRKQMESCWSEFDTILKRCWIAYRGYYA